MSNKSGRNNSKSGVKFDIDDEGIEED